MSRLVVGWEYELRVIGYLCGNTFLIVRNKHISLITSCLVFQPEIPILLNKSVYISETRYWLKTRPKECKDACIYQRLHGQICNSQTHMDRRPSAGILQHSSQTMELVAKEAICIQMAPESSHLTFVCS